MAKFPQGPAGSLQSGTLADLRLRVFRILEDMSALDSITAPIAAAPAGGPIQITVNDTTQWPVNERMEIDDEMFYVTVNSGANPITAQRAYESSYAAAHAAGAQARRSPRFQRLTVTEAINVVIANWCLPPDGQVIMAEGIPKAISDVVVGDEVLSAQGVSREVTNVYVRDYSGDMVSFKAQGLPATRLTADHKVFTTRGLIPARELQPGDRVEDPEFFLAEEGRGYSDGWLVGLYLAEGFRYEGQPNRVGFAIHQDEYETVAWSLNMYHHEHPYKPPRGAIPSGARFGKSTGLGVTASLSNPHLVQMLDWWVEGRTASSKRLRQLPMFDGFARGILDGWTFGDGWKNAQGKMVAQTASENLAWQMFLTARALGLTAHMWSGINRPGPGARAKGETIGNPCWRVTYHDTLQRPRRVTKVSTEHYEGPVYDIQVANDHSFLASGTPVSNCSFYFPQQVWDETTAGTFTPVRWIYPVPADTLAVRRVVWQVPGFFRYVDVDHSDLMQVPLSQSSTGYGFEIKERIGLPGRQVVCLLEKRWPTLVLENDALPSDFPPEADDLVVIGAALYIAGIRQIPRWRMDEITFYREQNAPLPANFNESWLKSSHDRWWKRAREVAGKRPNQAPQKVFIGQVQNL